MRKLIAVLLLACLLTGCAPAAQPTIPSTAPETEAPTTVSTVPPTTVPATEPTEPPTNLMDGRTLLEGYSDLYTLNNESLSSIKEIGQLLMFQDCILTTDYPDGMRSELDTDPFRFRITLTDSRSGQQRASRTLTVQEPPSLQICDDKLALTDWTDGSIQLLDDHLNPIQKFQVQTDTVTWNLNYLSTSAQEIYSISPEGTLFRKNLQTGSSVPLLRDTLSFTVSGCRADELTIHYLDKEKLRYHNYNLDLNSGSLKPLPFDGHFHYTDCLDGLWLCSVGSSSDRYLLARDDRPKSIFLESGNLNLAEGPAPLYVNNIYGEQDCGLFLYNEDGSFYAGLSWTAEQDFIDEPVWCPAQKGYLLHASNFDTGISRILFWQPTASAEGPGLNISMVDPEPFRDPFLSEALYKRAEEISEKYGVTVMLGSQCDTEFVDFTAATMRQEELIAPALEELDRALAEYPQGFFPQLLYADYRQTQIQLVGDLTATKIPEDANGFTSFAAFVHNADGLHRVVLDIQQPALRQTIFHEFSHVIDDKLEFHAFQQDKMYSELAWDQLNPQGFEYSGSVYNLYGSCYGEGFENYFIDTYARTNSTEDRARVLEYAMSGYEWNFKPDPYAPLREKLAFYSACIRDTFDTTGWPQTTLWEVPLKGYTYTEKAA